MTRTLLYYPSIDITNSQWIKSSILYWDSISSIVPRNLQGKFLKSKTIQILRDEGLYEPFHPDHHIEREQGLTQEFIERHQSLKARRLLNPSQHTKGYYKVYYWKFPEEARNYLLDHKYAIPNREWLVLDRLDGLLYMSVLAKYLANQVTYMDITPSTDYLEYQDLAFKAVTAQNIAPGAQITLYGFLPTPREDVPIKKLIEFKRKREGELHRFQRLIDTYHNQLQSATESKQVNGIVRKFKEEMSHEVKDIRKIFDDHKIPTLLGAVKTLLGIEVPALIAMMSSFADAIPSWLKVVGAGALGAISIRKYQLDVRNKQQELLSSKPYSYIYLAEKEGVIRTKSDNSILDLLR